MSSQVSFIDREEELALIDHAIREWDTRRVICINAEGGVGKTRLLQEVQKRHRENNEQESWFITDIIDFDNHAYRIPRNISYRIAQMLGERAFELYLQKLVEYRKLEREDSSQAQLAQAMESVDQGFAECFNLVSAQKRVVVFMDTADRAIVRNRAVVRYLASLTTRLNNWVLLIAGREAKALLSDLNESQLIQLLPFSESASKRYLEEKQSELHLTLEADLAEKLLLLAGGRPIMIDLAVESQARSKPLDWLVNSALNELQMLSGDVLTARQREFEQQLVRHITETRQPLDWLILMLARIYPLDTKMIVELLKLPRDEAATLLEEAQTYSFVKSLPDNRIALHDEMRRMVNAYVWPEVDPDSERLRWVNLSAVDYLEREIEETILPQIEQLESEESLARENQDIRGELDALIACEALEQDLSVLKERLLAALLFVDVKKGVQMFADMFDSETKSYHYLMREMLLQHVEKHRDELSSEHAYEVDIRWAKYFLDSGQYERARQQLKAIATEELLPEQHIDTLIQRANVEIRLGELLEGIRLFERAVQISQGPDLKAWLVKAETGLGWAYRLIHKRKEAGDHYRTALGLAREVDAKYQQVLLYNNLGFVTAYQRDMPGHIEKAIWFCKQALELSKELESKRNEGQSYSTLGCITFMDGRLNEAQSYFQQALEIFEPAHDREWLSTVYSWQGAMHMAMGKPELAEQDLLQALEMGIKKDRPINLSRLGRVYMYTGRLKQAQKAMEECSHLALELPDVLYQQVSLRDLAKLAFMIGDYEKLDEFERRFELYQETWGESQDSRSLGMLFVNFGALALAQSDLCRAIDYFESGLSHLAPLGRYGSDTFQAQIGRLESEVIFSERLHLPPDQIREIGSELLSFWRQEKLDQIHPDVEIILSRWAKWEGA
jgi:tetratricopeptide (TPR) repeat protein